MLHWTPEMQQEISRHCYAWREGSIDFRNYLTASITRFERVYSSLAEEGEFESICDVGGFFGVFPLAMARMGYSVAMTESLKYYSSSFDPLFSFLRKNGVRIIDYDPFESGLDENLKFDVVTILAVLEHYPHSLRNFMGNVLKMLGSRGLIYIDVPNIAYWPKRKALLMGKTPLVCASDIYHSAVPFIGHHHEYTMDELRSLAEIVGLDIIKSDYFNYSFRGRLYKRLYSDFFLTLMTIFPSMRECLSILARPSSNPRT